MSSLSEISLKNSKNVGPQKAAPKRIVGRERRERVSQLTWCGGGCFDSRRRVNSDVGRLPVGPLCKNMLSKKVLQFILLTFLITWSVAGVTYLLHIIYGSILFYVILAVCYMPAPAYATLILQKVVYRG